MAKSLLLMRAEVIEVNRVNGWYDQDVEFEEALALLHEEISEALQAWRKRGLESWYVRELKEENFGCLVCRDTKPGAPECPQHPDKPEGVPSEFADLFIRWLDYSYRFTIELPQGKPPYGLLLHDTFPRNINSLHDLVAGVSLIHSMGDGSKTQQYQFIYVMLRQLCELYEVDLDAEYERKLRYNKSRGYRHGNKRI